jgi:hypothetical protein
VLVLGFVVACHKAADKPALDDGDGPDCKVVTAHIADVMKQGKGQMGHVFDADVAQCQVRHLTKQQRTCLVAATTLEAIASCHAGNKPADNAPRMLPAGSAASPIAGSGSGSAAAGSGSAR